MCQVFYPEGKELMSKIKISVQGKKELLAPLRILVVMLMSSSV